MRISSQLLINLLECPGDVIIVPEIWTQNFKIHLLHAVDSSSDLRIFLICVIIKQTLKNYVLSIYIPYELCLYLYACLVCVYIYAHMYTHIRVKFLHITTAGLSHMYEL